MGRDIAVAIEVEIGGEYELFAMFPTLQRVEELFEAIEDSATSVHQGEADAETFGFFDDEAILRGTLQRIEPTELGKILHDAGRRIGQRLGSKDLWKSAYEFDAIVVMCGLLPAQYKTRILFGFDQ